MKKSEMLAKARERIESGRSSMICLALSFQCAALIDHIERCIRPYTSFAHWLRANDQTVAELYYSGQQGEYTAKVKAGRLALLDRLIDEYKAKGD